MEKTKGYRAIIASVKSYFRSVFKLFSSDEPDYEAIIASDAYKKVVNKLGTRFQALEVAIANGAVKRTVRGTELREIKQGLTAAGKKYLKQNAAERVVSISGTTLDRVKGIFQDIAKNDGDLLAVREALQNELQDILSSGKIDTIAVTEYRTAYNYGQNDALEALDEKVSGDGKKVKRKWVSAGDAQVRDSHQALDGETRDIDEAFSNGLMFPCDPAGPPEETINCRCSIEPEVVDE